MPIGRLDMASTGLLLLTNDTRLGHTLTDPANRVPRQYIVTVRGRVDEDAAGRLVAGLDVAARGGDRERLSAARVRILKASDRETHLEVALVEGRNREIRRLFEAIGHEVTRLHRVSFGTVSLGDLAPGQWRDESTTVGRS
jgi:23S rRNA pseudouridine2605 synthase